MIITNEPFPSGVHLNDVSLISPVFAAGELLGYVANLAHHVDVGGGAPAIVGAFREVFQEGVIIPPVKARRGRANRRRRLRADPGPDPLEARDGRRLPGPDRREHDRRAPARGAGRPPRRATIVAAMRELLDYTERRTRAELAGLPHGVYEAEGSVDTDGYTDEPVRLCARVEIGAGGVSFDLAGCDPQRRAPVNSTFAQTFSACAYALKCLIDPDMPVNDGFYRLVRARRAAGHGRQLHRARAGRRRLGDADAPRRRDLPGALAGAARRVPAGTKAMMCHAGFGGVDPRTASTSASSRRSPAATAGGSRATAPTRCRPTAKTPRTRPSRRPRSTTGAHHRLRAGRGFRGRRQYRGGLGLRNDYLFDRPTTFTVLADRDGRARGPSAARGRAAPSTS